MNPLIENIKIKDKSKSSHILLEFLSSYLNPAFGILPKKEIDLQVFKMLEQIGYINEDSTLYELVQKLRVTKTKARNLLYDQELRRLDITELDKHIIELLKNPILQKEGDLFLFEVENPLVSDHFKAKVQSIGYLTDGSFSPSIVRLSIETFSRTFKST